MIKSIQFHNFKVLREATLPLSRFTLIVGPNGSGKSTALQALQAVATPHERFFHQIATVGLNSGQEAVVQVVLQWDAPHKTVTTTVRWSPLNARYSIQYNRSDEPEVQSLNAWMARIQIYSLDASAVAAPVQLTPQVELKQSGGNFVGVLDRLRDQEPERFEVLNEELRRWLPEFDRILFDTPQHYQRAFLLRTRQGHHAIPAGDLSQGTLLALAILTLAYLSNPPSLVGLEEPDRGIHPRLLRNIQDALYRLSYPENFGEKREPVQVIATTHSPYFLDLFRDYPEEIVIAQKTADGARFERLSEQPHIEEILQDAPLGEVWYSGVLGGVPAEQ